MCDLYIIQLSPSGSVNSGGYIPRSEVFLSVRKTVNSQGYSELREPIKTRENCYPLIW